MKNAAEIQNRLTVFRDSNEIGQYINLLPDLDEGTRSFLSGISLVFINKLIKHLNSKRVSLSTVTNIIDLSYYRLQHEGVDEKICSAFISIAAQIVNSNFQGAFSNRLNVKSQEFMDLPDWDPAKE